MLYPGTLNSGVIDKSDPLVGGATYCWLARMARGRGTIMPNVLDTGRGILTGGPTWVETDYGPGIQTDDNKYVKLSADVPTIITGGPCSVLVAYLYRYDASTTGSDTESGILYSQGQNGLSLRHGNNVLEMLKSRISSFVSGAAVATLGQLCTAAFVADYASAKHFTLYFNGVQIATGTNATSFAGGTTATCLGLDFGATTKEYGRHTFLAAALYDSRTGPPVLTQSAVRDWDFAARQRFAPLYVRRSIWFGPNIPPAVSVSWSDTLTWSDTQVLAGVDAKQADTLTWSAADYMVGVDAFVADTLTFSETYILSSVSVSLADTVTWTYAHIPTEDDEVPNTDTCTWTGTFAGLLQIETQVNDLVIFGDDEEPEKQIGHFLTWLDGFFYDGQVFPPVSIGLADTLSWTMAGIEDQIRHETITWNDSFVLPQSNVALGDQLFWQSSFGADPNLLSAARYRR